ncbi:uncharacterized protein N7511_003565 [Penicillium nucicola]|uniref:uncharacterized protein n=1 Tax=Penicillium nucicola TaxID=1850975 RepID=UPI002545B9E1|nr:uncharacterized protein N7511_003565 [Penicillium nucicola]KAJ5771514.1 hypothetical protein N7511_003565 [Penicillium nucicola]
MGTKEKAMQLGLFILIVLRYSESVPYERERTNTELVNNSVPLLTWERGLRNAKSTRGFNDAPASVSVEGCLGGTSDHQKHNDEPMIGKDINGENRRRFEPKAWGPVEGNKSSDIPNEGENH